MDYHARPRLPSTPSEILDSIVRRLRKVIAIYNDANCFVSDDPIPLFMPSGKECATVSVGGGTFPAPMFGGAGFGTLTEDMTVTITTIVRHIRDRPRHREQVVLSDVDGLMRRRGQVLYALLNDDFDLMDCDETRYLLRDQLTPAGTTAPGTVRISDIDCVGASVTFHTPFDWNLGAEICQPEDHGE